MRVIKPGMLTTVQDRGRWGFQARGVPVAGPMDPVSHRLANALVGNDRDAGDARGHAARPGARVRRRAAGRGGRRGVRADARRPAGAVEHAVHRRGRVAAAVRRAAARRARLPRRRRRHRRRRRCSAAARRTWSARWAASTAARCAPATAAARRRAARRAAARRRRSAAIVPLPDRHARVRVLPGPQADYFARDALDVLQSAPYTIAPNSDRMGFRLEGPRLTHARGADIISDATPLGVLQVPASGQPILLMADRQTTGGYPKIATVITADIGRRRPARRPATRSRSRSARRARRWRR